MLGTVHIITPPPAGTWPVDLADAKRHLRIEADDTSEDDVIAAVIAAATAPLEGPSGWLGRALIKQTLELRLDGFPCEPIVLPCPPLHLAAGVPTSLTTKYTDGAGAEQTVDPDVVYRVRQGGEWPSTLITRYGQSWPSPRSEPDCVRIRYDAGYGAAGEAVDPAIRHAIRLMLGHLYEHREAVIAGNTQDLVKGYDALLSHKRVYL